MRDHPEFRKNVPLVNLEAAQAREGSPYTHVEVSLYFSAGGGNWVSGERNPKGFVLAFRGLNVAADGSFSFMMFTGWNRAFVVKPATRFSEKTLRALWADLVPEVLAAAFEADNYDRIRALVASTAAVAA